MGTRARRFFARFNRLEFSAPLVEASSGYPELLGQLIDAFTALHPLYGHALKLPGISLSSLHCCFLSRRVCPSRVCQFKGSFQLKRRNSEPISRTDWHRRKPKHDDHRNWRGNNERPMKIEIVLNLFANFAQHEIRSCRTRLGPSQQTDKRESARLWR